MLRTLDLFSGVGGITYALRGLAAPVMYCEKDPDCHKVLGKLMRQGKLPRAPIHPDVSKLTPSTIPGKIDMIVAGFPCIGFSSSGKRQGLDQPDSRLFLQVMRLARELRPPLMFFENVDAILTDMKRVVKPIQAMGYDMYWVVLPAYAVGAPQKRKRWFCLAVRAGVKDVVLRSSAVPRFNWKTEPRVRMVPQATPTVRARNRMMGNAVVPDCVRAAFLSLWTGCSTPIPKLLASNGESLRLSPPKPLGPVRASAKYACALRASQRWQAIPEPPGMLPRPQLKLMLEPRAFVSKKPANDAATSGLVKAPVSVDMWSTPRAGNATYAMNVLTKRGMRDLGSQLRFERKTPAAQRKGVTNPEFCEWLMGFQQGWTSF